MLMLSKCKIIMTVIAVFGAGGFPWQAFNDDELTKVDYRIKVGTTRNPYLKGYLKPLGDPGQIELIKTNIFNAGGCQTRFKK